MEQDGNYGNQVTLQAISNIYTIQIFVLSTLGVGADVDIQPQVNSSDNVQSYPHVFLGCFADGQGEHYVPFRKNWKITLISFPSIVTSL